MIVGRKHKHTAVFCGAFKIAHLERFMGAIDAEHFGVVDGKNTIITRLGIPVQLLGSA